MTNVTPSLTHVTPCMFWKAVEQVALGVAVHVLEQVVGRKAARLALRCPAGYQVASADSAAARMPANEPITAHQLQHAKSSCARISRWATCTPYGHFTVQPGQSLQRTEVCARRAPGIARVPARTGRSHPHRSGSAARLLPADPGGTDRRTRRTSGSRSA